MYNKYKKGLKIQQNIFSFKQYHSYANSSFTYLFYVCKCTINGPLPILLFERRGGGIFMHVMFCSMMNVFLVGLLSKIATKQLYKRTSFKHKKQKNIEGKY